MTDKEWKEEVDRAVAGAGLPCRVAAAWLERRATRYVADLTDTRSGKERTISLSGQEFATVTARRAEIIRQLTSGR
jgi:hypothetical protein